MMNNPMQMIAQMLQQSRNNPGYMVQTIMQQNPQFAQFVRGQNPRQMAEAMMKQAGIDPAQISQIINPGAQRGR